MLRGETLIDIDGTSVKVYPAHVALLGDIQALGTALLIGTSHKCEMPDLNFLVPQDKLDMLTDEFPLRTEYDMIQRCRQAVAIKAAAAGLGKAAEKEAFIEAAGLLSEVSLNKVILFDPLDVKGVTSCPCYEPNNNRLVGQPALAGFFGTDCYQVPMPDRMHTVGKGLVDYVLNPNNKRSVMHALVEEAGAEGKSALKQVSLQS